MLELTLSRCTNRSAPVPFSRYRAMRSSVGEHLVDRGSNASALAGPILLGQDAHACGGWHRDAAYAEHGEHGTQFRWRDRPTARDPQPFELSAVASAPASDRHPTPDALLSREPHVPG